MTLFREFACVCGSGIKPHRARNRFLRQYGLDVNLREKWELVIDTWTPRVVIQQEMHERLATKCMKWHYGLGIPAVAIAAISGASALIELAVANVFAKIFIGISGLTISVLTGIQTFLQLAGTAERHRLTSVRCKSLIRELELQRMYPPKSNQEGHSRMQAIHATYSDMEKDAPITMGILREQPKDENLAHHLDEMATASEKVTNLGFRLWTVAEASMPKPEPDEAKT